MNFQITVFFQITRVFNQMEGLETTVFRMLESTELRKARDARRRRKF